MTPTRADGGRPLRADARRNQARILDTAEQVFSELGPSASTEEVARRAGVAIGTVFRHFPTKNDLLVAIMKRLLARLVEEGEAFARDDEHGTALFAFFAHVVEQAATEKTVVDLLAQAGVAVSVPDAVRHLERGIEDLLRQAQAAGTVAQDVRSPEVMALLVSVCHGALHGGWSDDLRARTLAVVFAGLRPEADRRT
ncbi:TetR family transcriptional regulator [Streptosporangium minutum]|uniref:TetR family transcriptional regulator n=2 Tax=Streptosporangium minutum TaxID=569862 RepID=A0A243RJ85_9ACTN|nr:TetR family transcriptional regulator [Streptosporangium minutum]